MGRDLKWLDSSGLKGSDKGNGCVCACIFYFRSIFSFCWIIREQNRQRSSVHIKNMWVYTAVTAYKNMSSFNQWGFEELVR